jgi:hypothetical protein
MASKLFDLGSILSVTTGIMLVEDIGKLYKILNYMTGENLFTHQLLRASKSCAESLLTQFPKLREVTGDDVDTGNWQDWLTCQKKEFGWFFDVIPKTSSYEAQNPQDSELLSELVDMVDDPSKIIVVEV